MTSGRMSEVEFTVEGSKWKTVRPSRSAICKSLGMDVNMQFRKKTEMVVKMVSTQKTQVQYNCPNRLWEDQSMVQR